MKCPGQANLQGQNVNAARARGEEEGRGSNGESQWLVGIGVLLEGDENALKLDCAVGCTTP